MEFSTIIINKNRGWRGLAELKCYDSESKLVKTMMFSFSQEVWNDMRSGAIVTQSNDEYYVIEFDNTDALPKGQRSVLIKNFMGNVYHTYTYKKSEWSVKSMEAKVNHNIFINHFIHNRNNHTTSDWNCIGIRVTPRI